MRRRSLLLLLLIGCATGSPKPDGDRAVSRLMGANDRLKLEIQHRTAEPVDEAGIHERLIRIAANVEKVPGMDERRALASSRFRELAALPWTSETIRDHWDRLEQACTICHAALPPKPPAPPSPLRPIV